MRHGYTRHRHDGSGGLRKGAAEPEGKDEMGETGERNRRKQTGERKLGKPAGQSHGSSSPMETITRH